MKVGSVDGPRTRVEEFGQPPDHVLFLGEVNEFEPDHSSVEARNC